MNIHPVAVLPYKFICAAYFFQNPLRRFEKINIFPKAL